MVRLSQPARSKMYPLIEYARQFSRFQRNARLYLVSNVLSGITTGILLILYNLYLASLGYRADFIGLVLFVGTIGGGLAIFPAGVCVDRFGGKIVLICSTLLIGAIGIGQILFRQPLPLLATGFLAGVAVAALLVVNAPFLIANSTPAERPYLFSLNIVITLVTTVVGDVLGGALTVWFRQISWLMAPLPQPFALLLASQSVPRSYQLALLFAGAIAAPSLVPLFMLSRDRPLPIKTMEGTRRGGGGWAGWRGPSWPPVWPMRDSGYIRQLRKVWRTPFFTFLLMQVLIYLGAGLFIPYFNLFFVQHLGASSALFGLIDGGANGINALGTLAAPRLATHIGRSRTIIITRLISIPLLLTLGLTSFLPLAAVLYLFRQGFMDMSLGIFQVYSMEVVPQQHRGLANSAYQASIQVALAVTTPLGGLVIVHLGYPPIFIFGTVFYALAVGIFWSRFGRSGK